MDDPKQFERLAPFIKAWFAVSLEGSGRRFPFEEMNAKWLGIMALFAAEAIRAYVHLGIIDREVVERFDETFEPYLSVIFAIQANTKLMPYAEFQNLRERKLAFALQMLAPRDRSIFDEIVEQGSEFDVERLADDLGCTVDDVNAAWGRIQDTLSADPVIDDWLFGDLGET